MVYIHVPFCRSFCTYCDFYSETCRSQDGGAVEQYTQELLSEIASRRPEIDATLATDTLYVGGGTPSVLSPSFFHDISRALGSRSYREYTVEVNPEDIVTKGGEYAKGLLQAGVNRISMGVQSLDDGILRWMNRRHNAGRACEAYRILRSAGVRNISLDLIFGLSHLSMDTLALTLGGLVDMRPEHISAYQLSIEEGSALATMVQDGRYVEASQELCQEQYAMICRTLRDAGYVHYEISNWALPGYEAVHNSAYWTRKPYVGLGPGAHSFDGMRRSWNSQTLHGWTSGYELLSDEEAREEQIMLGLRTAVGVPAGICGQDSLRQLLDRGMLVMTDAGMVRIPEEHFFVSDAIIAELV